MLPLVAIATSLLPDLIKVLAGDKAGTIASNIASTVQTVTGQSDPAAAKQAVDTDPAVKANLQAQLAQIAVTAAKQQNDEADQQRQDQLDQLKQSLADVQSARANELSLSTNKSWIAWVAPAVSFAVMAGFYVLLWQLIERPPSNGTPSDTTQLTNICIGALVAAFSTVVNFWLGSSKGSQDKDQVQADQTKTVLQSQAQQTNSALNTATAATAHAATTSAAAAQGGATPRGAAPVTNDNTTNFNQCLTVVFAEEGGYTIDDGGPTNFGITLTDLKDWRNDQSLTAADVKNMTKAEAQEIYRSKYWNPMQCGDLPNGIDLEVFDFGVNAGTKTAIKLLQSVVGVTADGSIGPITLAAAKAADPRAVIQSFSGRRMDYYRSLTTLWPTYGAGWTNRTNSVERAALQMAAPAALAA